MPSKRIRPDVGFVIVAIICISVVFPAPFGPRSASTPVRMASVTSFTATTPLRKRFVTPSSVSASAAGAVVVMLPLLGYVECGFKRRRSGSVEDRLVAELRLIEPLDRVASHDLLEVRARQLG